MQLRLLRTFILLACILSPAGCSKEKSTAELTEDLKSGGAGDKEAAVRLLPEKGEDQVPALIEALKDKQANVRRSAAIALGYQGEKAKDAISALQTLLHDPDARTRQAAGMALARIDPSRFAPPAPKTRSAATK
jgi:HEAT repeat protein